MWGNLAQNDYTTVSITACPVRMVVIEAFAVAGPSGSGETRHILSPVIGIELAQFYRYVRGDDNDQNPLPRTEEDRREAGWINDGPRVVRTALYFSRSTGKIEAFGEEERDDTVRTLCYCPWPESEDEQRLAKEIERAKTLALEQLQDDFMAVVEAELGRESRRPHTSEVPALTDPGQIG